MEVDEDDPEAVERERLRVLKIDWAKLSQALPMGVDAESVKRREALFVKFDGNGNGQLSFSEIETAMRRLVSGITADMLASSTHEWSKSWKQVIMRAFMVAKDFNKRTVKKAKRHDDYVEKDEFRVLLVAIRQYFELYIAFSRLDHNSDRKIGPEEFALGLEDLRRWGITIADEDAVATFNKIDTNHGGSIMFDEFITWAIEQRLDLEDDDDNDDAAVLIAEMEAGGPVAV